MPPEGGGNRRRARHGGTYPYLVLSIPPKYSVAMVMGYLKGKSAIQIHRQMLNVKQGFTGKHFWKRGYCVSTVGIDEEAIRKYVRNQQELDRQEELSLNP